MKSALFVVIKSSTTDLRFNILTLTLHKKCLTYLIAYFKQIIIQSHYDQPASVSKCDTCRHRRGKRADQEQFPAAQLQRCHQRANRLFPTSSHTRPVSSSQLLKYNDWHSHMKTITLPTTFQFLFKGAYK